MNSIAEPSIHDSVVVKNAALAAKHSPTHVMRSATITTPRTVTLRKEPLPELKHGTVRVRLEGCGVCGSNLAVWEGRPWFNYPLESGAPGHEGWGVIDDVADSVTNVQVGDRVAVLSYHAFAEFDIADANNVAALPPQLDGQPFPGETLGCAMNVFRRSHIEAGHTVAIVGIGFLGAVLVNLAARAGAKVIAICRREFARDIAKQMGAAEVISLGESHRAIEAVKEITRGVFCERVIEATGAQTPLDLAGEITCERGRLIIAGYHQDGPREVNMQSWNWRGLDVINAHERDSRIYLQGMREAIEAVTTGALDPRPLYTHKFSLGELPNALDALSTRPENFLKALVTYD